MPFLEKILNYAFGKKDNMAKNREFVPNNILYHRYQKPKVLIEYLKKLPDRFTDDNITVRKTKDGRLGLMLPRKLTEEEIDGALKAFLEAHRAGEIDDSE